MGSFIPPNGYPPTTTFLVIVVADITCGLLSKAQGKRRIKVASNTFKIGATKSRLYSSVVANAEPASILFHQLHFIKTRE